MTDERDPMTASGAYALHALDPEAAREVEAAAADSEELAAELTELGDTAVLLGLSVAEEEPPAALKLRLLASLHETPQLPAVRVPSPTHERSPAEERAARRWTRRPLIALLSAAAAVLLIGGVAVGIGIGSQSSAVQTVASASDAHRVTVHATGGGTVSVAWSAELGRAVIRSGDLPALASDRTYQFWYIDGTRVRSAGLYSGTGDAALSSGFRHGEVIGVTVEPAGGSAAPTSTPIATIAT